MTSLNTGVYFIVYSEHCEVYNLVCSQNIASQFWIDNKPTALI